MRQRDRYVRGGRPVLLVVEPRTEECTASLASSTVARGRNHPVRRRASNARRPEWSPQASEPVRLPTSLMPGVGFVVRSAATDIGARKACETTRREVPGVGFEPTRELTPKGF